MIFFVLSGYFISSSVLKAVSEKRWKWSDYLLKRLIRLWIVLIPSLVLTLLWAKIQFNLFGETKISNYLDWKYFLGNLFFLQGIIVPVYGLNGPLWSLSYEFWYYIMFPFLVLLVYSSNKSKKLLYILMLVITSYFVGLKITEYFLVWLLGAIIPIIKPIKLKNNIGKLLILFFSILLLVSMKGYVFFEKLPKLQILPDFCIGISFSILLYLILSLFNSKGVETTKVNIPKYLASFSYSLYLTHFPLAHIILTWRDSKFWIYTGVEAFFMKCVIMLSVVLFAWFIALITENNTEKVRKKIFKLIISYDKSKVKSFIVEKS